MMISAKEKLKMVEEYVIAYNNFNIREMLKNIYLDIVFRTFSNGIVALMRFRIDEFERQTEEAKPNVK